MDIPFQAFADQFGENVERTCLAKFAFHDGLTRAQCTLIPFAVASVRQLTPLSELTHIVLTQLDPKSIPSLEALLTAASEERGSSLQPIQVVVSNPAARLLQSALGEIYPVKDLYTGS